MWLPLAQLVDLLPGGCWYALYAAGLSSPAVGFAASVLLYGFRRWPLMPIGLFYLIAVPPVVFVVLGKTENPFVLLGSLALMPVGIILGLASLHPVLDRTG